MPEQDKVRDYCTGLRRLITRFEECWRNKEGKFEVIISDDKGEVEWCFKGGQTDRSRRLRDGE